MNNEKIKKYIEYGKNASKDATKSNNEFYDMLETLDLTDSLDLAILRHSKANATADNTFNNKIRSLITSELNAELKAMKESK